MKIFLYVPDDSACSYYRQILPFRHCHDELSDCGIHLHIAKRIPLNDYHDYYIFSRVPQEPLWPLIDEFLNRGSKIIWDIDDDFWNIPEWNPFSKKFTHDKLAWLNFALRNSEFITVTTERLADKACSMGGQDRSKIHVLPNLIDHNDYDSPDISKFENPHRWKFLWAGSPTHGKDIEELLFFTRFSNLPKKHQFIFVGQQVKDHLSLPCCEFTDYARLLSALNCHFALLPLANNIFNQSKSLIKYYEMAMMGCVPITTSKNIYSEINDVQLIQSESEWDILFSPGYGNALKYRLTEMSMRSYDDVVKNHSWLSPARNVWVDFFKSLSPP